MGLAPAAGLTCWATPVCSGFVPSGHWRVCPHRLLAASWFLFLFSAALMRVFFLNKLVYFFFFFCKWKMSLKKNRECQDLKMQQREVQLYSLLNCNWWRFHVCLVACWDGNIQQVRIVLELVKVWRGKTKKQKIKVRRYNKGLTEDTGRRRGAVCSFLSECSWVDCL